MSPQNGFSKVGIFQRAADNQFPLYLQTETQLIAISSAAFDDYIVQGMPH
ncbi:MAG: hypothetical protein ING69_02575 [Rhodocyclaceae bacterium]|nr:hypothetical protein [Rhodocyclaceae bacterium]MCA3081521.1 hypothetical protein [Rhodocyclaceae bacterium]